MIRKIIKIGNSEGVTIPVSKMRAYKFKVGDKVEVYIGKPGSEVRFMELMSEFDEFSQRPDQTLQDLTRR